MKEALQVIGEFDDTKGAKGMKGDRGKGKGKKGMGGKGLKGKGFGKFGPKGGKSPYGEMISVPAGPVKRVQMNGVNRQRNSGIHTVEVYFPQFYIKQIEMEEYDAQPHRYGPSVIGKYTKGIGQIEARFPTDDEDPVSFVMSAVHRLMERMTNQGFNETARYSFDGMPLNAWNAVGRLDIGSESLIDRSKSMKAYVMDLFERFGDGEHDIEGVDMYNACYGGQAAGLCCLSWVESDRWDGRYAIAAATDISEATSTHMFTVGAACTATLYFPDAPVAVHSHRTSCILHRFDFFKPVGWFTMSPIVDGKYSIDCYMQCIDACYQGMKKKMNDREFLSLSDYNVFHTGGGYHVVKKAFERVIRNEEPKMLAEQRDRLVVGKLNPSCHLLKLIGPCHTVSSFLNISSVCMSQWDKALGRITIVFTYGSGAAASMYQLRHDDIPWMKSLGLWKCDFYRSALHQNPWTMIHEIYCQTWMKFDYQPVGRTSFEYGPETLEKDAYYLMEIDPWGRRFYHRGGMATGPLDKQYHRPADVAENRHMRERYLHFPVGKVEERTAEDEWKELEYEMTYNPDDAPEYEIIEESFSKKHPDHKTVVVSMIEGTGTKHGSTVLNDGEDHTYQIIGTWNNCEDVEEMERDDDSFSFEITLGINCWEKFYLIQDNDPTKKIYPAYEDSNKDCPCIGPHSGGDRHFWLLEGREGPHRSLEDVGVPGDKYTVTFRWETGKVKQLTWEKTEEAAGEYRDDAIYYLLGSWTCWEYVQLEPVPGRDGHHTLDVQMTSLGIEFQVVRNRDLHQRIWPETPDNVPAGSNALILGPDRTGVGRWRIDGTLGDIFRISFVRRWLDGFDMKRLTWDRIGSRPVIEPEPRYFAVGSMNDWAANGVYTEMTKLSGEQAYTCDIQIARIPEEFQIVENKSWDRCVHPDKRDCVQTQAHQVLKNADANGLNWALGKGVADKPRIGDRFRVRFDAGEVYRVTWKKTERALD